MIDPFAVKCPYCKTSVGMLAVGYLTWMCLICGNTFRFNEDGESEKEESA